MDRLEEIKNTFGQLCKHHRLDDVIEADDVKWLIEEVKRLTKRCDEARWILSHSACGAERYERRNKWLEDKP